MYFRRPQGQENKPQDQDNKPQGQENEPEVSELDYGFKLPQPPPGLIKGGAEAERKLARLFAGLEQFEESIGYKFKDKAYLVQAFTHSSYIHNNVTDCYQRCVSIHHSNQIWGCFVCIHYCVHLEILCNVYTTLLQTGVPGRCCSRLRNNQTAV